MSTCPKCGNEMDYIEAGGNMVAGCRWCGASINDDTYPFVPYVGSRISNVVKCPAGCTNGVVYTYIRDDPIVDPNIEPPTGLIASSDDQYNSFPSSDYNVVGWQPIYSTRSCGTCGGSGFVTRDRYKEYRDNVRSNDAKLRNEYLRRFFASAVIFLATTIVSTIIIVCAMSLFFGVLFGWETNIGVVIPSAFFGIVIGSLAAENYSKS